MPVGTTMVACERCSEGIFPETPTAPYCERCARALEEEANPELRRARLAEAETAGEEPTEEESEAENGTAENPASPRQSRGTGRRSTE